MAVYKTHKKLGETPLECLNRVVSEHKIPDSESITFAGRLDPAAEGEMIFLSGQDIASKDAFMHADKIYVVDFILGISTDTGDLLGLVKAENISIHVDIEDINKSLNKLTGTREQFFHSFSSKVVDGMPLWMHARSGEIKDAKHTITVHNIEIKEVYKISWQDIYKRVIEVANLVQGDFRQEDIKKSWDKYKQDVNQFSIVRVVVHASSGTYMRVLGEEMGELLGIPVCAYSIVRERILS